MFTAGMHLHCNSQLFKGPQTGCTELASQQKVFQCLSTCLDNVYLAWDLHNGSLISALTRVVFEDMDVSKAVIAPLKACKPLQEVAFDNCLSSLSETFDHGLPARVRVRSFTRRFQ